MKRQSRLNSLQFFHSNSDISTASQDDFDLRQAVKLKINRILKGLAKNSSVIFEKNILER